MLFGFGHRFNYLRALNRLGWAFILVKVENSKRKWWNNVLNRSPYLLYSSVLRDYSICWLVLLHSRVKTLYNIPRESFTSEFIFYLFVCCFPFLYHRIWQSLPFFHFFFFRKQKPNLLMNCRRPRRNSAYVKRKCKFKWWSAPNRSSCKSKRYCANKKNWTPKSVDLPKLRNTSKKKKKQITTLGKLQGKTTRVTAFWKQKSFPLGWRNWLKLIANASSLKRKPKPRLFVCLAKPQLMPSKPKVLRQLIAFI